MEASSLPEDVDQDEVDEAARRVRGQLEAVAAELGMQVAVREERREGRVWVIGYLAPLQPPDDRT